MTLLPTQDIDGIDLKKRESVGARLQAGLKKPDGRIDPSSTERWWFGCRHSGGSGMKAVTPPHPSYWKFNNPAADVNTRKTIRGRICHDNVLDSCKIFRQAWDLPCVKGTDRYPACTGNSIRARRLISIDAGPEYQEIPCPGQHCEFAIGEGHPCSPYAKLYFRPEWPEDLDYPTGQVVWVTKGTRTIQILLGFWCHLASEAASMQLMPDERPYEGDDGRQALARHGVSVMGLPFELMLEKRSSTGANPNAERRRVTVVTITARETFSDVLRRRTKELGAANLPDYKLIGARSAAEHDALVVAADREAIISSPVDIPVVDTVDAEVVASFADAQAAVDCLRSRFAMLSDACENLDIEVVSVPEEARMSWRTLEKFLSGQPAKVVNEAIKLWGESQDSAEP